MRPNTLLPAMFVLNVIVLLGCPNPVTPPTDTVINIGAIPGITAPSFGATPVTSIAETAQYTGTVVWSGAPATFAASTVYTATITLTAKTGYTLTGVAADFFSVAGATSNANPANSGVVTAVFPTTGAAPDTVINIGVILGITSPSFGATPVTTIAETAQYTGTVVWSGAPATFAASTVYTATITLTAKIGYTLTGVAADFFSVAGATSYTNPANSGVVTAVFPTTLFNLIMISVPAGRFQRDDTTTNISEITQTYRISQHEITRAQFQAIMGSDPSNTTYSSSIDDPVQMVNWYHAIAFCNKLSLAEELTPVYSITVDGTPINWSTITYESIPTIDNEDWNVANIAWAENGYRLPTEMEWMWAAMGSPEDGQNGGINTTGYLKSYAGSTEGTGSTNIGYYAWYNNNSNSKTHSVGTKSGNELGLHDMSGNVWEWCWDWGSYAYPSGDLTDYRGPVSGTGRVLRGGSWQTNASACTVANTYSTYPDYRYNYFGFRVVRP